jgi:hypothetical protein
LGKYCWGNSPPNTPRACQIVDNFLEWALRNYRQFDMHSGYYYVMTIHKKVLQMCTIMNTCLASWKKLLWLVFDFLWHLVKTLSLFDTMLNFVENLLENERDPRSGPMNDRDQESVFVRS